MTSRPRSSWRIWDTEEDYGLLLFKRATGQLPEMESSKAVARIVKRLLPPGGTILDAGCGAGHYLRSLKREIAAPFRYTGLDSTRRYIELAREAWREEPEADFHLGDIFALPFADAHFDVVISCNVFLHLPSIKTPLRELVRVARRHVLVRTLVGERSFRIQEVYSPETHPKSYGGDSDEEEFDDDGEPKYFHYYNIYSRSYVEKLLKGIPGVQKFQIYPDTEYDPQNIEAELTSESPPDATRIIGGLQINGYILQPWHFIEISKERYTRRS